jgi:hypothetical protein
VPDPDPDGVRRYLRTDALRLAIRYTERVTPQREVSWPGTVIEAAKRFERYIAEGE